MARPKKDKPRELAAIDSAKETLDKAKAKAAQTPANAGLKADVQKAEAAYKKANDDAKRFRFVTVTAGRAEKAILNIANTGKALSPRSYQYSPEEAEEIAVALEGAVADFRKELERQKAGPEAKETGTAPKFSFQK